MTGLPVFVISLAWSVERRAPLLAALMRAGIAHEVVEAADGATLVDRRDIPGGDAHTLDRQPLLGRRLTPGEIGCAVSHLMLWRRIAASARPAVVLEDDCQLAESAPSVLERLAAMPHAWDLVLLGHRSTRRGRDRGATPAVRGRVLGRGHRLARLVEFATDACAYAISPRGAERLARFAEPIRVPADWITGYAPMAGVRLHGVTPPCAAPAAGLASTIAGREAGHGVGPVRRSLLRAWVGTAWLHARRLGMWPASYTWPYASALQPRRGSTTTA
jgi:glycosyl transferase family 25